MTISLHTLLTPQVILKAVSRIRKLQGRLGRWIGFQPKRFDPDNVSVNGPNTRQGDTRFASFRLDDVTRVVAKGRAPGVGPASVPPNPVGEVRISCARFHEKVRLLGEMLGNLSPVIGPNSQIDTGGQNYIARQIVHLAEKYNNTVELMTVGMFQDNLYFQFAGDNLLPTIGAPAAPNLGFQIPFQIPAGNKGQVQPSGHRQHIPDRLAEHRRTPHQESAPVAGRIDPAVGRPAQACLDQLADVVQRPPQCGGTQHGRLVERGLRTVRPDRREGDGW